MLFDLCINFSEFTGLGELSKSNVETIQRVAVFLLCLSEVVNFIGDVRLWRELSVEFLDGFGIIVVVSVSGKVSNMSPTSGPA